MKKSKNNKVIVITILLLCIISLGLILYLNKHNAFAVSSSYGSNKNLGDTVKNIFLNYFDEKCSSTDDETINEHKLDGTHNYKYLINHYDIYGNSQNFMDTFISTPSAAYSNLVFERNEQKNVTLETWDKYIATQNANLYELNEVAVSLNKKVNVALSLVNPLYNNGDDLSSDYTYDFDGDGSNEDLSTIINIMLHRQTDYWQNMKENNKISNLKLIGFYWDSEDVYSENAEKAIKAFNECVKNFNSNYTTYYKTIWIPYIHNGVIGDGNSKYQDSYENGYDYGFDYVSLQSGYYFFTPKENTNCDNYVKCYTNDNYRECDYVNPSETEACLNDPICKEEYQTCKFNMFWSNIMERRIPGNENMNRLEFAQFEANKYNMGVELEADWRAVSDSTTDYYFNSKHYDLLYNFMSYGTKTAKWNQSYNTYYFPDLAKYGTSENPINRQIYDDIYNYSQGKEVSNELSFYNAESCRVKFNSNGGNGSTNETKCTYPNACTLTANEFSKNGYTFNGWNTKSNGDGISYIDNEKVNNTNSNKNHICYYSYTSGTEKVIDLYAQWIPNSYTINYDKNGADGTKTMTTTTCTYDNNCTLNENKFTRTDYSFTGWNTKSDGTGTSYSNSTEVKNLTSTNGATITLYAQWTPNNYTKLDESLKANKNNIITNVPAGNKIDYVYNRINTSGTISIFDRNNALIANRNNIVKTGDKFKIELSNNSIEYILSIKGDTNGDGNINIMDIIDIAKTITNSQRELKEEFYLASDVDENNNINVMDIIKIAKYITNNENF